VKEIVPSSAEVVQLSATVQAFQRYVVPSYAPSLVLEKGQGARVWDEKGKAYLDFGTGIAVNCLGHAHPAVTRALMEQSQKLVHVSNLYFNVPQVRLAEKLVNLTGPGKIFFCNSGAEANEMQYKLARLHGHAEGRYEVITALQSFHGRTLAGIAATGQEKVKKGFEPAMEGFRHVPFNDLEAMRQAVTDKTAAILIEGIQGEGGVTEATPEYLLGLRRLCTEKKILLMMDGVQCGMFRTGMFQSYMRILEGHPEAASFMPDSIAMAKSLGGGVPIGAVWVKPAYADLFQPGSHGTTYGGNPLVCSVALAVIETIERENLAANIRRQGEKIIAALERHRMAGAPVLQEVRGYGGLIGLQIGQPAPETAKRLREAGLIVIPAGAGVLRVLPPYNVTDAEVDEALGILTATL
jgi:acetylornithine/N-succinyldiaminopimelate aminotransferase